MVIGRRTSLTHTQCTLAEDMVAYLSQQAKTCRLPLIDSTSNKVYIEFRYRNAKYREKIGRGERGSGFIRGVDPAAYPSSCREKACLWIMVYRRIGSSWIQAQSGHALSFAARTRGKGLLAFHQGTRGQELASALSSDAFRAQSARCRATKGQRTFRRTARRQMTDIRNKLAK
jgi:hypothetical protein